MAHCTDVCSFASISSCGRREEGVVLCLSLFLLVPLLNLLLKLLEKLGIRACLKGFALFLFLSKLFIYLGTHSGLFLNLGGVAHPEHSAFSIGSDLFSIFNVLSLTHSNFGRGRAVFIIMPVFFFFFLAKIHRSAGDLSSLTRN